MGSIPPGSDSTDFRQGRLGPGKHGRLLETTVGTIENRCVATCPLAVLSHRDS